AMLFSASQSSKLKSKVVVENANFVEGESVKVWQLEDEFEEARKIFEIIEEELARGTPEEEICVLYRTHKQGSTIAEFLQEKGVKLNVVSEQNVLNSFVVRFVLAYLNLARLNALHENAGKREISQALWRVAEIEDFPYADLYKLGELLNKSEFPSVKEAFAELEQSNLSDFSKTKFSLVKELVEKLSNEDSLKQIVSMIVGKVLAQGEIGGDERNCLLAFENFVEDYLRKYDGELSAFLSYVGALEKLGIGLEPVARENKGVSLMSMHATKGLEFDVVIVTNLVEGRCPITRNSFSKLLPPHFLPQIKERLGVGEIERIEQAAQDMESKAAMNEERRLFYVAITRAKKRLYLTYARNYNKKKCEISRFIKEISLNERNGVKGEDLEIFKDEHRKVDSSSKGEKNFGRGAKLAEESKSAFAEGGELDLFSRISLSPSALLIFERCEKMFEYYYILRMPDDKADLKEVKIGQLVHLILENGVKRNFQNLEEFMTLARTLCEDETLVREIEPMLRVFVARHKGKYNEKSLVEVWLARKFYGLNLIGKADRIDFLGQSSDRDANSSPKLAPISIVDYKTSASQTALDKAYFQLGYYALACARYGRAKELVLEHLRGKQILLSVDNSGNAFDLEKREVKFNIFDVQKRIIELATAVKDRVKNGFAFCPREKKCEFCRRLKGKP
ncbi:ATP-dependent helicase, partial [Candidatus Pacearchaeota archaeon]